MEKYVDKEISYYEENQGDVLACRYYHSFVAPDGIDAIGDCGTKKIDNKDWDIFHIQYETEDAYYGTPMLGIGLINCMILKKDTRKFLQEELTDYNVELVGSNTGKFVRNFNIKIEPIVDKYNKEKDKWI